MSYLNSIRTSALKSEVTRLTQRPRIFRIPKIHDQLISDPANKYLIIKGGRGGFKTMSFLGSMVEESYVYRDCTFVCAREISKSIEDSVYSVVKDIIGNIDKSKGANIGNADGALMKVSSTDFIIKKNSILNRKTNVRFVFIGLRATGGKTAMSTLNKTKGLHKIRIVFLEEGQDITEDSLNVLLPTANRGGGIALLNPRDDLGEEYDQLKEARFFVAMNPNKEFDPVVSKFNDFISAGVATVAHINMKDIGGELYDTEPRTAYIVINGKTVPVQTEPDLQDRALLNEMALDEGNYAFDHKWLGAAYHKFAGLPWSTHKYVEFLDDEKIEVLAMWLDPSFKGGDYAAIAAIGRRKDTRKIVAFGRAYKSAWNMEPAISGIVDFYRKWRPMHFWYEDNSLGTVPNTLFAAYKIPAHGETTLLNKEDKIYKAAAHTINMVEILESQSCPIWLKLVKEYNDDAEHDDPPDSLASLIMRTGIIAEKIEF